MFQAHIYSGYEIGSAENGIDFEEFQAQIEITLGSYKYEFMQEVKKKAKRENKKL